jgi:hypothetical protein
MEKDVERTHFDCLDCGRTVFITINDWGHYELKGFYCPDCHSCIAKKRYKINIPGAKTVFYHIGEALGDVVVFDAIRRAYLQDNPGEEVVFMQAESPIPQNITKFFISDLRVKSSLFTQAPHCYEYILINEVTILRQMGIFPKWDKIQKPDVELPETYIALQLRNVAKADFKNVTPAESMLLFEILNKSEIPIVLIGNDEPIGIEQYAKNLLHDLRFKLSLDEIACVCRNSKFTVCKDSGIGHLAGAAGGNIVSWGFVNKKWMPYTENMGFYYMNTMQDFIGFVNCLRNNLGVN